MSEAKREPGPEALAYGQALKKIFLRLGKPQREVAGLLRIDPSVLSRFFSGKPSKDSAADTVAAKEHADALIRLVRNSGATVTDAEETKLHELRRAAQAASSSQQDRVLVLQEQLDELQQQLDDVEARAGTFRGQAQSLEGANSRLEDRVGLLQQRVREEERRAGREHWARVKERRQREQADARAEGAERQAERSAEWAAARVEAAEEAWDEAEERARQAAWGAEEAAARLRAVEQARAEAEERAARAVWGADETAARLRAVEEQHREAVVRADEESRKCAAALAELAAARKQLSAAAAYTKTSDARIEAQQEQLRQLRQEVKVLRRQVSKLTEEASRAVSTPIADVATQVSAVAAHPLTAGRDERSGTVWPTGGRSSAFMPPVWPSEGNEAAADGMPSLGESGPAMWPETPREERLRARQAQSAAEQARRQQAKEQAVLEAHQRSAAARGVSRDQISGQEGARSVGMEAGGSAPCPPAGRQSEAKGSAATDGLPPSAGQQGRSETRFPPPPEVQAEAAVRAREAGAREQQRPREERAAAYRASADWPSSPPRGEGEHRRKPPQPQDGGRAVARRAYGAGGGNSRGGVKAQTPARPPVAPKKRSSEFQNPDDMHGSSSGVPSKRQGAKPPYGGRAAARRNGQSAAKMRQRAPAKRASSAFVERQAADERDQLIRGAVLTGQLTLGNCLIALALHAMWNSDKAFTSGWWFIFSFGFLGMLSLPVYAYREVKSRVVKKSAPLFVIAAALVAFACDLYSLTPHFVHQVTDWFLSFLLRQA
ncbi:hypothetical protein ACWD3J_46415 [Streptomyces sp. NPDC002755]|uniref:hypothetical protein n=1 Tax=Streptomyces sp. NPDC002884 TaxID=3154544 RepID=UPI00332D8863